MPKQMIESITAKKVGWGTDRYRRVTGLTQTEREAVKEGDLVWFRITPQHYTQSGYKIVMYSSYGWDAREPSSGELALLRDE